MVSGGHSGDFAESADAFEDAAGVERVVAHLFEFGGVELAGLVEDEVGDAELADVVEESGAAEETKVFGAEAEHFSDAGGDVGDAFAVAIGPGAFGVDDLTEADGNAVEKVVGGVKAFFFGLEGHCFKERIGCVEACPEEGVVSRGVEDSDEVGVEPGAAAGFGDGEGVVEAIAAVENFNGLGESEDAGEDGDFLTAKAGGMTLAVPVLVEAADGESGFFGHGEVASDGCAAIATDFDKFASDGFAMAGEMGHVGDAGGESGAWGGVAEKITELAGEAGPIAGFEVVFGLAVVGVEEVADFGGVAGAAEVFEDERVKEGGALFGGEVNFFGDAHADHAGSDGMAFGLAFGDVERV